MNSHTFLSIFTAGAFALAPCVCADGLPAYAAAENARLDREMTPLLKLSGPAEGNLARGKCYVDAVIASTMPKQWNIGTWIIMRSAVERSMRSPMHFPLLTTA